MTILHITNWYPSKPTRFSAKWIQNHIKALSNHATNIVYHLEIRKGKFKIDSGKNDDCSSYILIDLPVTIWILFEIVSFFVVAWVLLKNKKRRFDIINFHIAYPNCTYVHFIKRWIKKPIVITEHWSAYYFNFNIKNPKKRKRIQKIFQRNLPVITVSKSLLYDIKKFSNSSFKGFIIPNVVNTELFKLNENISKPENDTFFAVSQWKWPKDPFTILKAWKKVTTVFPQAKLKIGGYGPQIDEMKKLTEELDLRQQVILVGPLRSEQIAWEMQHARIFIHCSEYETFSVVCAEALCCGTPVIASKVGGIPDYIHSENGILVPYNTPEAFFTSIIDYLISRKDFDLERISKEAVDQFSEKKIGIKYYSVLSEIFAN
jgi:glycosyltransferase involved in cell wall biosynthesis